MTKDDKLSKTTKRGTRKPENKHIVERKPSALNTCNFDPIRIYYVLSTFAAD
jgi:hypothetical protein